MIEDFDQQNPNDERDDQLNDESIDGQYEEAEQQTPQQFVAEEERKLSLRRIAVIGGVIFIAVFYFVWGNYLNFGYLQVKGATPFSVAVIDETTQECLSSPCDIKLKRGDKIVTVYKSGFETTSIETEVLLWATVVIKPIFKLEPSVREVTEIPEGIVESQEVKYNFIYDQSHNNYAIVKANDPVSLSISYFGGKLQSPFILGSENTVLAFENEKNGKAFYINTITKERNSLKKTFDTAFRGNVSPNGRYFLIENSEKKLFVSDQESFSTIKGSATLDNAFWTLKNTLILAYFQREKDSDGVITDKYIFDEYDPGEGVQRTLFTSNSMIGPLLPKNIKVNSTTNTIFFESGEKKYELIF